MSQQPQISRRQGFGEPSAARIIDLTALTLVLGGLSLLWFYARTLQLWLAVALAACVTLLLGSVFYRLYARARARQRARDLRCAHMLWFSDEMAFAPGDQLYRFASDILQSQYGCRYDGPVLRRQGEPVLLTTLRRAAGENVSAADILLCADTARAQRVRQVYIAATAEPSDSARQAVEHIRDVHIEMLDIHKLADVAWESGMTTDEETLSPYRGAARALRRTQRGASRRYAALRRPIRLGICGVMLGILAIVSPFPTWYLISSAACFVLGAVLCLRQILRENQSCK